MLPGAILSTRTPSGTLAGHAPRRVPGRQQGVPPLTGQCGARRGRSGSLKQAFRSAAGATAKPPTSGRHTPGTPAGGAPAAAPFRNANAAKSEDAWASDGSHAGGKRGRKCFSSFARSACAAAAESGRPNTALQRVLAQLEVFTCAAVGQAKEKGRWLLLISGCVGPVCAAPRPCPGAGARLVEAGVQLGGAPVGDGRQALLRGNRRERGRVHQVLQRALLLVLVHACGRGWGQPCPVTAASVKACFTGEGLDCS